CYGQLTLRLLGSGRHQRFMAAVLGAVFSLNRTGAELSSFAGSSRGLASSAWWPLAAGRSRARQLLRSLRRVARADLTGGVDLAAGSPRRSAAAREAAGVAKPPQRPAFPAARFCRPRSWPHACPR